MPRILQLSPHVADLIAAGEVVERPGSVIKELMENSIDAGATSLTVEIRRGGMSYMRVTDNGCGIAPEDAGTAFLRHATSKLRDEKGLEAIGTLGFRGEALAAISAVSRMEMLTRETGAAEGTRVLVDGGEMEQVLPAGCPEGTTMVVRDLFFNTPARLKFMKNDKAEGANVTSVVLRCAMSHPEISVRYIREGKEEFHTPGDGRADSCIYSLLGRDFAGGMLPADTESDGISVKGYVCAPAGARGNRSYQFFFVNGRMVKSKTLQAALEQAYKNQLFTGRFPSCVLYLSMSTAAVDVNVHPAKTEVRFLHEKAVFDGVYYAVLGALGQETKRPALQIPEKPQPRPAAPAVPAGKMTARPDGRFYQTMTAEEFRRRPSTPAAAEKPPVSRLETGGGLSLHDGMKGRTAALYRQPEEKPSAPEKAAPLPVPIKQETSAAAADEAGPTAQEERLTESADESYRVIGEALGTYILVEKGEKLFFIDKHAAHERMIFDRLKSRERSVMAQYLLQPAVVRLTEKEKERLLAGKELLDRLGFDVEEFGEGTLIVRQVPADVDTEEIRSMLEELAEKLTVSGRLDAESPEDRVLHTVACKAAIKAGRMSDRKELETVASEVMSGRIRYCPHGRPVAVELTKSMIDKNFKRI